MRPVEARERMRLHATLQEAHRGCDAIRRCVVGDPQGLQDPPLLHALEVAHAALQEVRVGEDDLLAGNGAHTGGLEPDVLHGAREGVDRDRVAYLEGSIEDDGERREEVAEHVLHGERDRDAADAEPGQQRGDVVVEDVAEGQDEDEGPEQSPGGDADGPEGAFPDGVAVAPARPGAQGVVDERLAPRGELQEQRDRGHLADAVADGRREREERTRDADGERDDEVPARPREQLGGEVVDLGLGLAGKGREASTKQVLEGDEGEEHPAGDESGGGPGAEGIVEESGHARRRRIPLKVTAARGAFPGRPSPSATVSPGAVRRARPR